MAEFSKHVAPLLTLEQSLFTKPTFGGVVSLIDTMTEYWVLTDGSPGNDQK